MRRVREQGFPRKGLLWHWILVIALGLAGPTRGQTLLLEWVADYSHTWRFQTNRMDGVPWRDPGYDDSSWPRGAGLFFIEEADLPAAKLTPLPARPDTGRPFFTYCFRTSIVLTNVESLAGMQFELLADDGAVVYVNGHEIQRVRMPPGPILFTTPAAPEVTDVTSPDRFFVPWPVLAAARVRNGTNWLAAEVHQGNELSSDVVFGLRIGGSYDPNLRRQVWLVQPPDGAQGAWNASWLLEAVVTESFGPVERVEFLVNGESLGNATAAPFTWAWTPGQPGEATLEAVVHSPDGRIARSEPVRVEVKPPPAPRVVRGPYLQSGAWDSVVVRWRTDAPTRSVVRYGTNLQSLDREVRGTAWTTNHQVRLTGLLPATRYYYAVGSDDGLLIGPHPLQYYQTAPPPGTPGTYRIWVIGDAGAPWNDQGPQLAVRNAFYAYNGQRHIDVWLQLGDNAYPWGTDDQYQIGQFDMYSNLLARTVTWPALGNHDTANATTFSTNYPYFEIFTLPTAGEAGGVPSGTPHWFSFDYGHVHFICLDSMTADLSSNAPMARWLRADLAANTNFWVIAYFHHSPYSRGHRNSDTDPNMRAMRENIVPILEAGGVDLVLGGHSHSYERSPLLAGHYGPSDTFQSEMVLMSGNGSDRNGGHPYIKPPGKSSTPQGTVYAVVGSSGMLRADAPLNHPAMQVSLAVLGSVILEVQTNRLDAWFLRETGEIADHFAIVKAWQPPRLGPATAEAAAGRLVLRAEAVPGRLYTWETAQDLTSARWLPGGKLRANDAGRVEWEVPLALDGPTRFFRLRQ